jgi:hypothetical protein
VYAPNLAVVHRRSPRVEACRSNFANAANFGQIRRSYLAKVIYEFSMGMDLLITATGVGNAGHYYQLKGMVALMAAFGKRCNLKLLQFLSAEELSGAREEMWR